MVSEVYRKRVKIALKSNLNAKYLITAMYIWAVEVVKYSVSILKWTKEKISTLDRRTRKSMLLQGTLHSEGKINLLFMKRKKSYRGLINIDYCIISERRPLA